MMLHAKTDSDGSTSSTPKSTASNHQPLYYVISPPHDFSPPQTSPLFSSPINSPLHPSRPSNSSNTSSRVHSHSSYSSRVSGFGRRYWSRKRGWNECNVIKEEEDCDFIYCHYQRCKCFIAVFALAIVFTLFCLILWGASRPYHPHVSLQVFCNSLHFTIHVSALLSVTYRQMIWFLSVLCFIILKIKPPPPPNCFSLTHKIQNSGVTVRVVSMIYGFLSLLSLYN